MIDLHCDTMMKLLDAPDSGDLYRNSWKVDIERLKKNGASIQDFALFIDMKRYPDFYERYQQMKALFKAQIKTYGEHITHVLSYQDIQDCYDRGKPGALLSIEEGGVLNGDVNLLKQAYDDGVRLITLTWNYTNEIGEPHCGDSTKGLTEKGKEFVLAMQELGMIVDCSHLNDAGIEDLGDILDVPFTASHSNARALTNHSRNLPDSLIRLIADKGGVIGLNFCQSFLGDSPVSRIADMVRHGVYIINTGGEDVIALGTDFDGIKPDTEIKDIADMNRLYDAFRKAGLTAAQTDKLFGNNADRFLKEIL